MKVIKRILAILMAVFLIAVTLLLLSPVLQPTIEFMLAKAIPLAENVIDVLGIGILTFAILWGLSDWIMKKFEELRK